MVKILKPSLEVFNLIYATSLEEKNLKIKIKNWGSGGSTKVMSWRWKLKVWVMKP